MAGAGLLFTPLHAWHQGHGGRLVEFGGWSMPVQYSTIVEEHLAVRRRVGLFDISHMGRLSFEGPDALAWLERATTNQVAKLRPGQIQYSLMVDDGGLMLDDVLVYRRSDGLAMVCNASNRPKVLARLEQLRDGLDAQLVDHTFDSAMIAVQGPAALAVTQRHFDGPLSDVPYYHCVHGTFLGSDAVASRTGLHGRGWLRADRFRPRSPRRPGKRSWTPAGSSASCRAAWGRVTRSGSRRGCRSTVTRWTRP